MDNYSVQIDFSGSGEPKQMLEIDDSRVREEVIRYHFFRFYEEAYGVKLPGILVDRDGKHGGKPYDFIFKSPTGSILNLELTYLFDNAQHFLELGVGRAIAEIIASKGIGNDVVAVCPPLVNLGHIRALSPGSLPYAPSRRYDWLEAALKRAAHQNKVLIYRRHSTGSTLHTHFQSPHVELFDMFESAVRKKVSKPYVDPKEVTLLLDEATYFSREGIKHKTPELIRAAAGFPFGEIFLYSGAYSRADGNESEFAFYPLKSLREHRIDEYLRWPLLEP